MGKQKKAHSQKWEGTGFLFFFSPLQIGYRNIVACLSTALGVGVGSLIPTPTPTPPKNLRLRLRLRNPGMYICSPIATIGTLAILCTCSDVDFTIMYVHFFPYSDYQAFCTLVDGWDWL